MSAPSSDAWQELAELQAELSNLLAAEAGRGVDHLPAAKASDHVTAAEPRAPRSARAAPRSRAPARRTRQPARPAPDQTPVPQQRDPANPPGSPSAKGLGRWGKLQKPEAPPAYGLEHAVGAWGFGQPPPLPEGSPARAQAERLLAVRRRLGECQRCRLAQGRNRLVFGMGAPNADLVIMGEGPGQREDEQGLPFVGPAGEMLDKMLQHVLGLSRSQVYILNVVKCRPPNNRDPRPDEISACRPVYEAQLAAIQPKLILTLGSPAVKTLLATSTGIMRLRGRWQRWRDIPVMPTFHPAYLLRRPEDKRFTFQDLKEVRRRYDELGGLR